MHCVVLPAACRGQPEGIQQFNTLSDKGAEYQLLVDVLWNAVELLRVHQVAADQVGWQHSNRSTVGGQQQQQRSGDRTQGAQQQDWDPCEDPATQLPGLDCTQSLISDHGRSHHG